MFRLLARGYVGAESASGSNRLTVITVTALGQEVSCPPPRRRPQNCSPLAPQEQSRAVRKRQYEVLAVGEVFAV